jgi:XTP/dITP diphosphohydrolase
MSGSLPLPLVLATQNVDKAREIVEILVDVSEAPIVAYAVDVQDTTIGYLLDSPGGIERSVAALRPPATPPDVTEDGDTLEENARIKGAALARALDLLAIADDTGLEVDALGGAPGVRAARYAGEHATYHDNVVKLLAELGDGTQRSARFATVAIACWPDGRDVAARGEVEGRIGTEATGGSGFGYDPVFVPVEGDGRTFAEMSADEKHSLSHRGRAFRSLAATLLEER